MTAIVTMTAGRPHLITTPAERTPLTFDDVDDAADWLTSRPRTLYPNHEYLIVDFINKETHWRHEP